LFALFGFVIFVIRKEATIVVALLHVKEADSYVSSLMLNVGIFMVIETTTGVLACGWFNYMLAK